MESPFLKAKIHWEIDSQLPIAPIVLKKSIHSLTDNKYQFDTDKIKQILEFQPWVAKAHITEQWLSNDIQIKIKSQQIAMRWENNDCKKRKHFIAQAIYLITVNYLPLKKLLNLKRH
ncbi:protein containingPolypeptide-transport-associated, FtsQ-type domain [Bathymodiolus azoricus thioautotrophic gill symbiont]|uniref:Protein containingPolypeptide-transport-associated, FtsQ-type domain n=1 Tax=Bathymodiolus azoricus thioautotrophic gill symbiont TaxID=235205 RepID=A0A1H6LES1_9GAMM|nr:protein containingPolypeptide-transport-associated, FtsQ-type domain [Bathymodiolus azoricus thioautotrophic gill symbiont]